MFKLINTVMRILGGGARVQLGAEADDHVQLYWEHLELQAWMREADDWAAEREARAAEWDALSDDEREAIIAWCDDRNAEGRLEDHRFYRQWLALRMHGYVGD